MRNQDEEPSVAIFALGNMRVVINLEDGTVRSQDTAARFGWAVDQLALFSA